MISLGLFNCGKILLLLEGLHFRAESEVFGLVEICILVLVCFFKDPDEGFGHHLPLLRRAHPRLCSLSLGDHRCIPALHRLHVLVSEFHKLKLDWFGQRIEPFFEEELLELVALLDVHLGDA